KPSMPGTLPNARLVTTCPASCAPRPLRNPASNLPTWPASHATGASSARVAHGASSSAQASATATAHRPRRPVIPAAGPAAVRRAERPLDGHVAGGRACLVKRRARRQARDVERAQRRQLHHLHALEVDALVAAAQALCAVDDLMGLQDQRVVGDVALVLAALAG